MHTVGPVVNVEVEFFGEKPVENMTELFAVTVQKAITKSDGSIVDPMSIPFIDSKTELPPSVYGSNAKKSCGNLFILLICIMMK